MRVVNKTSILLIKKQKAEEHDVSGFSSHPAPDLTCDWSMARKRPVDQSSLRLLVDEAVPTWQLSEFWRRGLGVNKHKFHVLKITTAFGRLCLRLVGS